MIEVPDHVYVLGISSSISDAFESFALVDVSAFRAHTCVYVASAKDNAAMASCVSMSEICNG